MKGTAREYRFLNKEMDKKHQSVKQEWNYLESQSQIWKEIERRTERKLTIITWIVVIVCIISIYLIKHYKILGG